MFTGIIEETGIIESINKGSKSAVISINADIVTQNTKVGDSIAVNGVCLTVTKLTQHGFTADIMAETLRRSSLGVLGKGSQVNLERAMSADGRFGGHIVSGHIDGTGTIKKMEREDNAVWITVSAGNNILKYIVEKGSIAIDGISLTVAYVDDTCFKVSVIPHTSEETTLLKKKPGDVVNLENDIIGKYVDKLLKFGNVNDAGSENNEKNGSAGIDISFLSENGFM